MTSPARAQPPTPDSTLERAEAQASEREAALAAKLAQARSRQQECEQRLVELRARLAVSEVSEAAAGLETLDHSRPAAPSEEGLARARLAREAALTERNAAAEAMEAALAGHERAIAKALEVAMTVERKVSGAEARLAAEMEQEAARLAAKSATAARSAQEEAVRDEQAPTDASEFTPIPDLTDTMISRSPGTAPPLHPALRVTSQRKRDGISLETAIDLGSESNFFTGFSTDVSEGGVFVATLSEVAPGTAVELDLSIPGHPRMPVRGTVRWIREANLRAPEMMPGLGVQFAELPPEIALRIGKFVKEREPLFFPS